jgi:serine/threonine protein kinase
MTKKGDVAYGCVLLNLFCKLCLDQLDDFLGKGSFGIVQKAFHQISKKQYAIKMSSLEKELDRKVADAEKDSLKLLNGFSPYLVNLIECFDEVCYRFQRIYIYI